MPYDVVVPLIANYREFGTSPRRGCGCCPAHPDSTASLYITEGADDRLLIHCFASCSAAEIMAALGLQLRDLFPRDLSHGYDPIPLRQRRPCEGDLLRILAGEAVIVAVVADRLLADWDLDGDTRSLITEAAARIGSVRAQARNAGWLP